MSARRFFITGLPRSRTAWLALFMTAEPESFCFHDALADNTVTELVCKMRASPHRHVGDSDSALAPLAKKVIKAEPLAAWVRINRPLNDAIESYLRYFGDEPPYLLGATEAKFPRDLLRHAFQQGAVALGELDSLTEVLDVQFSELDSRETMERVWRHCIVGVDFPEARWNLFKNMRVNMIPGRRPVTKAAVEEILEGLWLR